MTCSSHCVIDGSICYFAAVVFVVGDDDHDDDNRNFLNNWFKISVCGRQKQASDF